MTIRLGILGATGFIGSHLFQRAKIDERFSPIAGNKELFADEERLVAFLRSCDEIVDLAGVSRAEDQEELYRTNMELVRKLVSALQKCDCPPRVYFGSTTHIGKNLPYHQSKRASMEMLSRFFPDSVELLMPNTFGPLAPPFYNSVVSTFCVLASRGRTPERVDDVPLELIPVEQLTAEILDLIAAHGAETRVAFSAPYRMQLPELWKLLCHFKECAEAGVMPELKNPAESDLWYTFRSY